MTMTNYLPDEEMYRLIEKRRELTRQKKTIERELDLTIEKLKGITIGHAHLSFVPADKYGHSSQWVLKIISDDPDKLPQKRLICKNGSLEYVLDYAKNLSDDLLRVIDNNSPKEESGDEENGLFPEIDIDSDDDSYDGDSYDDDWGDD